MVRGTTVELSSTENIGTLKEALAIVVTSYMASANKKVIHQSFKNVVSPPFTHAAQHGEESPAL